MIYDVCEVREASEFRQLKFRLPLEVSGSRFSAVAVQLLRTRGEVHRYTLHTSGYVTSSVTVTVTVSLALTTGSKDYTLQVTTTVYMLVLQCATATGPLSTVNSEHCLNHGLNSAWNTLEQ